MADPEFMYSADVAAKLKLETEPRLQKIKAKQLYLHVKQCGEEVKYTETGRSEMITFDFMQNIPFPHIPISEMFCMRQVWMYVFGIH